MFTASTTEFANAPEYSTPVRGHTAATPRGGDIANQLESSCARYTAASCSTTSYSTPINSHGSNTERHVNLLNRKRTRRSHTAASCGTTSSKEDFRGVRKDREQMFASRTYRLCKSKRTATSAFVNMTMRTDCCITNHRKSSQVQVQSSTRFFYFRTEQFPSPSNAHLNSAISFHTKPHCCNRCDILLSLQITHPKGRAMLRF